MRLFISIQFTEEVKDALQDVIDDLRAQEVVANYTQIDNLHLTLAFLGEVPGGRVAAIEEALKRVPFEETTLVFDGIGNFGNLLWVGMEENDKLKRYVRELRNALSENGIDFDRKPFKPHITIARKVESMGNFKVKVERKSMTADSVSLMRSDRVNGRIRYTELTRFGL